MVASILASLLAVAPTSLPTSRPTTEPAAGRAVYVGQELMTNYDPQSTLVLPEHHLERAKFDAIDIHCHWSADVDPQFLVESMDKLGIAYAIDLSGGSGDRLLAMLDRFSGYSDRLLIFANLQFTGIDEPGWTDEQVKQLRVAHEHGARGLKIFKDLGLTVRDSHGRIVPLDDPRLDPIWDAAGEMHMPVLIHTADPLPFFQPIDEKNERWMQLKRHPDWSFYGKDYPDRDELLMQRNCVVARHPNTNFIGAHLAEGGENLKRLGEWLDEYPNLYVDISGRVNELGRQPYTARKFILKHPDRVLFGTDRYPGRGDQPRYHIYYRFLETDDEYFDYDQAGFPVAGEWKVNGLYLPDDVLQKVYFDNAAKLLGIESPTTQGAAMTDFERRVIEQAFGRQLYNASRTSDFRLYAYPDANGGIVAGASMSDRPVFGEIPEGVAPRDVHKQAQRRGEVEE